MKLSEIPAAAFNALATPVPTKVVHDWEVLYRKMVKTGYVIIESNKIRVTTMGSEECVPVKQFNCYVRQVKNQPLRTKRISNNRWFCCL
jgi:hypothetical protein